MTCTKVHNSVEELMRCSDCDAFLASAPAPVFTVHLSESECMLLERQLMLINGTPQYEDVQPVIVSVLEKLKNA